jgi:hypothetical protein
MTEQHRPHLAVHVNTVGRSEAMLTQDVYSPNWLGESWFELPLRHHSIGGRMFDRTDSSKD